jgi:hypothetical protein
MCEDQATYRYWCGGKQWSLNENEACKFMRYQDASNQIQMMHHNDLKIDELDNDNHDADMRLAVRDAIAILKDSL